MVEIYHNSLDKKYGFHSFYENFLEICNGHKDQDRALAFAFILYDFESPQLLKVLRDTDYWRSLNQKSGNYLTVFSIHYKEKVKVRGSHSFSPKSGGNNFSKLDRSSNQLVRKYFGEINIKYPAILFFQVDKENVTDALLIELDEKKIESAFLELKEYIDSAVQALESILPEYRKNHQEIFNNLDLNVRSTKTIKRIKRFSRVAKSIIELASTVEGMN